MTDDMPDSGPPPSGHWYDQEAGPLVRPYAMTGGRTQPGPAAVHFDLIALVSIDEDAPAAGEGTALGPEHRALIELCRAEPQSVAELAAGADLPVGVVRVLLGTCWSAAASWSAARCRPPACPTSASCAR